ncbi:MAG TPA: disulfide bond formation protein B [Acidimicrobiia bacterium]|nr:disulfide bond formation protein B [Acidimicrobiia bacterium]
MHGVDTANIVFTVLTLLANVALVALVLLGIAARIDTALGRRARRALGAIGPRAGVLAAGIAIVTTLGSLYYSEVVGYLPCELCWYQRIAMYPLSAILVVGLLRRDRAARWYALPFVVVGAPLALYHWLVERVPSLAEGSSCSAFVPCSIPYFQELGYVTLAFMDMSAFLLIGALLLVGACRPPGSKPPAANSPAANSPASNSPASNSPASNSPASNPLENPT